jgi:stage II sporulation protein D
MRSSVVLLIALMATAAHAQLAPEPRTVRIGVLSLFHPQTLALSADRPITLQVDGSPRILDARHVATIRALDDGLSVDAAPAHQLATAPVTFTLSVPGKLARTYRGALTVSVRNHVLVAVIAMDTELAVASIIAAEAPPHAPLEALKAQAVASRSFLLAHPSAHRDFDACDTTHCQYLRSPPASSSPAFIATRQTRNVVLTWRESPDAEPRIVAAMYSRSCGGQTRVPGSHSGSYPFYSVRCEYCRRHPELWSRPDTPVAASEQARLAYNRDHGWQAIPSNNFIAVDGALQGRGTGHGVGMCQLGAADLAGRGATFSRILDLYYPNTALALLP